MILPNYIVVGWLFRYPTHERVELSHVVAVSAIRNFTPMDNTIEMHGVNGSINLPSPLCSGELMPLMALRPGHCSGGVALAVTDMEQRQRPQDGYRIKNQTSRVVHWDEPLPQIVLAALSNKGYARHERDVAAVPAFPVPSA